MLRIAILSSLGICIFYGLRLRSANERLISEMKNVRESTARPLVVRNLDLDMESMLTLIEEGGDGENSNSDPWRLVLLVADRCSICKKQVPVWQHLLERETVNDRLEVWLISSDEGSSLEPLMRTVRDRRVPFRRYRVKPASAFSFRTGIGMVPTTLIIHGTYVKIVHAGLLTEEKIPQIEQALMLEGIRTAFLFSAGEPISFQEK